MLLPMKHLRRILRAGIFFALLNILWEFSHYSLYVDLSGIPPYPHLLLASLADTLILLGIFAIVSLKNKSTVWMDAPGRVDYLLIAVLGVGIAVFIEWVNVTAGRWMYTPAMPTLFGIGVSPLIQLALTGIVSLIMARYIKPFAFKDTHV